MRNKIIYIHHEAEKRNPFSFIHNFLICNIIWQNLVFLFINELTSVLDWVYTNLHTLPCKKFDISITSLIMVYKTVLQCIRHKRLLICCQMRRHSSYHLSGHRIVQTFIRLNTVFVRWYKTKSTKRRLIMLMNWSSELWGCAMRWNGLSTSDAKRVQMYAGAGGSYFEHLMWFWSGRFICVCWWQRH